MNMILQGTTPQLIITIPETVPLTSVIGVELTISHKDSKNIIGLDDVTVDSENNTITYTFTEAQTLALDPRFPVQWQLRLKTASVIVGTLVQSIKVYDLISEDVMA